MLALTPLGGELAAGRELRQQDRDVVLDLGAVDVEDLHPALRAELDRVLEGRRLVAVRRVEVDLAAHLDQAALDLVVAERRLEHPDVLRRPVAGDHEAQQDLAARVALRLARALVAVAHVLEVLLQRRLDVVGVHDAHLVVERHRGAGIDGLGRRFSARHRVLGTAFRVLARCLVTTATNPQNRESRDDQSC